MIAIRDGERAQFSALAELWRAAWQITYPEIDFAERLPIIHGQFAEVVTGRYRLRVAICGGLPTGFTLIEPDIGLLEQIVVAPPSWGGGVASALIADAMLPEQGASRLVVNQINLRAIRFYRKHGMMIVGEGVSASGRATYTMALNPGPEILTPKP